MSALEHRLPNPPPMLIARERDTSALAAAIARAPITIAYGRDSVGKGAVVLDVLHRQFPGAVERALYLQDDALSAETIVRQLATASSVQLPEGSTVSWTRLALDLAESVRAWIVIDGWRTPDWELAALVGRYARDSKWIITTDSAPTETVLEYVVSIAALANPAMQTLARTWHPGLSDDECALAVAAARGQPGRLRRFLTERMSARPGLPFEADAVTGRVLDLLSATSVALPPDVIREAIDGATDDTLRRLDERGVVTLDASGIALHPAARPVIATRRPGCAPSVLRHVAAHLAQAATNIDSLAESLRLSLVAGAHDQALMLLGRDGERLFASSSARRVADLLIAVDDPTLTRWRLRAAVERGDGDVLPDLVDDNLSPADRTLWAEALLRANRIEAALALIADVPGAAARLLAARGLATRGALEQAASELERLRACDDIPDNVGIAATALGARIDALAGRASSARATLVALRARLATLPEHVLRDILQSLASTFHDLGDLTATEAMLDRLDRIVDDDALGRFVARRSLLLRSIVLVERGELEGASARLAALDRATGFASLHRPFLAMISAQLGLARGELRQAAFALASIDDGQVGSPYIGAWASALSARISIVDPDAIARRRIPTGTGLWPACARLHHARFSLRHGDAVPSLAEDRALVGDDAPVELWFAARAHAWESALLAGHAASALAVALDTAKRCADQGFTTLEAESLSGAIDAALVARDPASLELAIGRLETAAARLQSPRYVAEIAFARELPGFLAPERLELLAAGPMSACTRRARWLLGDSHAGDRIDSAVLTALRVTRATSVMTSSTWTPGWGVDRRRRCAWHPDGTVVQLSDKPQLWRLLESLVASPSGITKEALVVGAWGVAYHPLRHDKLLHNSIHKLRKLIEDGPGDPRRIPTTPDGYRIGDDIPVRVIER